MFPPLQLTLLRAFPALPGAIATERPLHGVAGPDPASMNPVGAWIRPVNPPLFAPLVPASSVRPEVKRAGEIATLDFPLPTSQ